MDQNEAAEMNSFDMSSLQNNLPQKRGLSRYYSGKARSFTCIAADVHCLEDLKKEENPDAKKRKLKYSNKKMMMPNNVTPYLYPYPYPWRRVSSSTQCATPYVH